ncbi:Transcription initiation factor TFIID subunit 9 [Tulasnella sp. 419]|nr:Transcription initiation factor TFIID subunit 9 [Tulasnella sp. 418]KAG8969970.1 Transcription initiation factor TFIID subunit 9 [Tulasnella sp. 419]
MVQEILPRDARLIALLISGSPSITDAQPAVLHQLLEFAHRYTSQVLSDALVYSEHAGRGGMVDEDDVRLAVQSRVGWEFGGRVPKELLLSLAAKTNAKPLPPVPEVFGVRLPPPKSCLTSVDFDLVPNKPPPGVPVEEDDDDEDDDEAEDATAEEGDGDLEMADGLFGMDADDDTQEVTADQPGATQPGGDEEDNDEGGLFGEEDEDQEMQGVEGAIADSTAEGLQSMVNGGQKRRLEDDEDDDYDA